MDRKEKIIYLMIQVQRGDQRAFVELMEMTQENLMRTAYLYLRDKMLAEDVVNETYMALITKCETIQHFENIEGWLKTITINKALNILKKRKRETSLDDNMINYMPNARTAGDMTEDIFVRDCLSKIKEEERLVLLYKTNGFTLSDIASEMDCSIKKVRILMEKAKTNFTKLYKNLKD